MKGIMEMLLEVKIMTMNHDEDYAHVHMSIPQKMRVSEVVRTIKTMSARILKSKFEYMKKNILGSRWDMV